jgi:hypothetical protein
MQASTPPLGYYVALDSADVADELWAKFGPAYNTAYNNQPGTAEKAEKTPAEPSTEALASKEIT